MSNRTCIICQTELTGRQQNACSAKCANKVYSNRRRESGRLKNANLTAESVQRKLDAQRRWRKANKKIVACPVCGIETVKQAGSDKSACSLEHGQLMAKGITFSQSQELIRPLQPKHWHGHIIRGAYMTAGNCRVCNKSFVSKYQDVTCSDECFKARRRITGKQWMEQEQRKAIYARDNWTCGICKLPVPEDTWEPNTYQPLFPSLDHIIPVSKGGDNSATNLRLAHTHCNSLRGADTNWAVTDDYRSGIAIMLTEYL